MARITVAMLLALEGFATGVATLSRVQSLPVYPPLAVSLILLRGVVGVFQFASAWMLLSNPEPGRRLARAVLVMSAAVITLELGFGLAPTSLFPAYHRPVVIAYWIYAVTAVVLLKSRASGS